MSNFIALPTWNSKITAVENEPVFREVKFKQDGIASEYVHLLLAATKGHL